MFEYLNIVITIQLLTNFEFWWIFLFLERDKCVVKLKAANVNRQYIFFFALFYV